MPHTPFLRPLAAVSVLFALTSCASPVPDEPLVTDPRVVAHFDRPTGQEAESVVVAPDGSVSVGLISSRQVARVTPDGQVDVVATMPLPAEGGEQTPATGTASVTGIERTDDGTLYFLYSAGDDDLTGLWRLRPSAEPERISALPAASFLNGLTRDEQTGTFYITDSTQGLVWTVGPDGGNATLWADGEDLAPTDFFGANGVKVHDGAVWVSNIDRGTILRIALDEDGTAGEHRIMASGLDSVDDFAFTGRGDQMLVALNVPSSVVSVTPGKPAKVVLDESDGIQNATAIAVDGDTVYVASSALTTGGDANLLTARLRTE